MSDRPPERSGLLRANAMVALGTLLSRLTGFARFALLVALTHTNLSDAYNVANNVPNMLIFRNQPTMFIQLLRA